MTTTPQRPSALARLYPLLFVALWSTGFIGAKFGLPDAEPLTFLSVRYLAVLVLMGVIAWLSNAPWPKKATQWLHIGVSGLLVHALYLGGVFTAIAHGLPAGVTALVVGLQPVLTALGAGALLGERVRFTQWIGLALGFAGVALVVAHKVAASVSGGALTTMLAPAVLALLGITAGTLYQKRFCPAFDLRTGSVIQFLPCLAITALIAFETETMRVHWTGAFVFALGWLVLVLSLGAVSLLNMLIRRGSAVNVASLFYLTPPSTALMAWALFGETLTGLALVGMGLVGVRGLAREAVTLDNRPMPRTPDLRRLPLVRPVPWVVLLGYFVVFLLLDRVSFIRPLQHLNITPWNPQPALAVALLLASRRLWWVVWASLLAAEVLVRGLPGSLFVDLATASALTGSYLVIAAVLQRILRDGWRITSPRVVALLIGVIAAGALLSGIVYVGIFAMAGLVVRPLWEALARYWVGEVVGMVVVLPIVLGAMDPERRQRLLQTLSDRRWWMIAATVGLLLWGLWRADPAIGMDFSYLLLLPVVWAATQFGTAGALLSALLTQIGLIVTVQAVHHQDLIVFELQLLMAGVTITGLLLGVVVDERQRADAELRRSLRLAAAGQMSAALAHELSQPLTALASYAQACKMLLQTGRPLAEQDHAQLSEVTRRIGEDAIRAGEIIRRLRDFFRSGTTQLRPTDLGVLFDDALAAQAPRAQALGTRLEGQWPGAMPLALIDGVQIEVVLRNLLTNAIDASSPLGSAGLVTVRGSRVADVLLIEVLDNGPGVPAAQAFRIFDGGESEKLGGMGVGLSICRAIVEAHGGRLWVEPGTHGHFCLTLPVESRLEGSGWRQRAQPCTVKRFSSLTMTSPSGTRFP